MRSPAIIPLIIVNLLCACDDRAPQKPGGPSEFPKTLYVQTVAGLYIRERPTQNAKIALIAPFASRLEALDYASGVEVISGISGRWLHVRLDDTIGFAFSGHLSSAQPETVVEKQISPNRLFHYEVSLKVFPKSPVTAQQQLRECSSVYSAANCTLRIYDHEKRMIRTVPGSAQGWLGNQVWTETYLMDAGTASSWITLLEPLSGRNQTIYFNAYNEPFEPNAPPGRNHLRECITNFCIDQEKNHDVQVQICPNGIQANSVCTTQTTLPSRGEFGVVSGQPSLTSVPLPSSLTLKLGVTTYSIGSTSTRVVVHQK